MQIKLNVLGFLLLPLLGTGGCSKKASSPLTGNASFLNGATSKATLLTSQDFHPTDIGTGSWYLTPDQMTLTVTSIGFRDASGNQSNSSVSCEITTDKTKPSLATLVDCPFSVSAGTYTSVSLQVSTIVKFKIDDASNGIYSKASATYLLDTSGPAETVSVDLKSCGSSCDSTETFSSNFPTPITISSADDAKLYIIIDATHFLSAGANGGSFSRAPGKAGTDMPLIPLATPAGKVEFYANTGSADNVNIDTVTTTPNAGEAPMGIRLYYGSDGKPAKVNIRYGSISGGDCTSDAYSAAFPGAYVTGDQNKNWLYWEMSG